MRGPAHRPKIFFRVAYMAAGLLTIRKDGLGAALGTVGAPVPSDEHCEAMRRSEVTAVTRGPSGGWSVRGPAHCPKIFFRVAYMAYIRLIYGCRAAQHA